MFSPAALPPSVLVGRAEEAIVLTALLSLPVVAVAGCVGVVVAALQAATQVQDATLAHLPRIVAVVAALVVLGPWMGGEIAIFAERLFSQVR